MGNYRFLDAWAKRDQRRFENPPVPGAEPAALRILQGSFSALAMVVKLAVVPLCLIGVVGLIAHHTVQSIALAVTLVMIGALSVFTTSTGTRARRESGVNWLTGLAPRPRSN